MKCGPSRFGMWSRIGALRDRYFSEIFICNSTLCVTFCTQNSFFPLSQSDLMSLRPGRSFLVSTRWWRGNEKSTLLELFFYSEKGVEWCRYFCNRWKFFSCGLLRSHGNQGPHFMNFQCIDDFKSVIVLKLGIDSPQNPAPLLNSSRQKLESN